MTKGIVFNFCRILIFSILFNSCFNDVDLIFVDCEFIEAGVIDNDSNSEECEFLNLGITDNAKTFEDLNWRWRKRNNRLIIKAQSHWSECEEVTREIEFEISECPTIFKSTIYRCFCDAECINPLQHLTTSLQLQEWDLNSKVVGKNGDTFFWVELTAENRLD